jgi:rod shape-determining protein MreC
MQKRKSFFPTFLVFFILALLIFFLSRAGLLQGLAGFFETGTVPLQRGVFGMFHSENTGEIAKLKDENSSLAKQLVDQKEMTRENQALRDQFQTTIPAPRTLLPVNVIGGNTDSLTIDRGESDNIKEGMVVVLKDNLIGKIGKVSRHLSIVNMITSPDTAFTAQTLKTETQGVLKAQSGNMILDNVVLSDKLEKDDLVVTKGDKDISGHGFPPDLVVGKIVAINKKASNLFQSAEVRSLVDFGKLQTVFVIVSNN